MVSSIFVDIDAEDYGLIFSDKIFTEINGLFYISYFNSYSVAHSETR